MHSCRFCKKEFPSGIQLGGHVASCKSNPGYAQRSANISKSLTGKRHTLDHRDSVRRAVEIKVAAGTWHNSFSRSRTHLYKDIKLYGLWEVKFAQYLDSIGVQWSRPISSFSYMFCGRERQYTPDFYIIDADVFVEIKGYKTLKDEAKWECFPHKLLVLRGRDLASIGLDIKYKSSCA